MATKVMESARKIRIEEFAAGTDPAVYAAVCMMKGWRAGKSITEADWEQSVDEFLNAAAGATPRGSR